MNKIYPPFVLSRIGPAPAGVKLGWCNDVSTVYPVLCWYPCSLFTGCFVGTHVHCLLDALLILASAAFLHVIPCTCACCWLNDSWYSCLLLTRRVGYGKTTRNFTYTQGASELVRANFFWNHFGLSLWSKIIDTQMRMRKKAPETRTFTWEAAVRPRITDKC